MHCRMYMAEANIENGTVKLLCSTQAKMKSHQVILNSVLCQAGQMQSNHCGEKMRNNACEVIWEFKVDIKCILPYCHHNDKVQYLNRIGSSLAEGTSLGYLGQCLRESRA